MRAVAQIKLEEQFVLEDSMVKKLIFDVDSNSILLDLLAPIFKGHCEYGGMFNRFKRHFCEGVYLNSDARNLTIYFSGCKLMSKSKFDEDENRASPINYWSFETSENGSGSVVIKADDIEVNFHFDSLSYRESNI